MVRFSCFHSQSHSQKPKRMVEPTAEAMHKSLQDSSLIQASKSSSKFTSLNSLFQRAEADAETKNNARDFLRTSSIDLEWKSDKTRSKLKSDDNTEALRQAGYLRKCQSLGDKLCNKALDDCGNDAEYEIDQGFSSGTADHSGSVGVDDCKIDGESPTNQQPEAPESGSVLVGSDIAQNQSIFSVGDHQQLEKECAEDLDAPVIGEGACESVEFTTEVNRQMLVKSCSLPNIAPSVSPTSQHSDKYLAVNPRSSEDLQLLEMKWQDNARHEVEVRGTHERVRDECLLDDDYDAYNYYTLAKDWIIPETDEVNLAKSVKGKAPIQQRDEINGGNFKVKRIEAWVSDLQHCRSLEVENELVGDPSDENVLKRDSIFSNDLTNEKLDAKVSPGMEIARRYISSLNASATSAQLSNHGLVAIPFFSAFGSLRALNLSGNSIEKITAGALPRGLHALNLSKNKISSIEGLRELTRLRVLDLSYNRIVRIGHGLASCSSLKELYLMGNRISEVEGLHRLLKLTVLDLRFNKIASAKSLGQLAANYSSLQAISLEGNPAQKNVGDEQLKKCVLGILPHLVYYNRQPTKSSTLKDAADRSVRLGISAHQFDRGLRPDSKTVRKAGHGASGSTRPSSSSHARRSQVIGSPKRSKGRHGYRPPTATSRTTAVVPHNFDWESKLRDFRSELALRRSRSEGTLGAL